jgi:hypothetical protein
MGGWFAAPPDVVEVIPGLLIGSAPNARAIRRLVRLGVTRVMDLTEGGVSSGAWPDGVVVESQPLVEYSAPELLALDAVSARVAAVLGQGHTVLVHCRAGVQRAPMVACATLVQLGWPLADAVRLVRQRRTVTDLSEAQLAVLQAFGRSRPGSATGPLASAPR